MSYQNPSIAKVAGELQRRLPELDNKSDILKSVELKALFDELKTLPPEQRAAFGQEVNNLRAELQNLVSQQQTDTETLPPIDITAPMDLNVPRPQLLPSENGSVHPLMQEKDIILDIFYRMGFTAAESREIDDAFHVFDTLNFPQDHPARDDYDSFMTEQTDEQGQRFIAPPHTSAMQNRILQKYKQNLEAGQPIAVIIPDRVFRNEDVDARHGHTFYQFEGVYVDEDINTGNLIATLKTFLEAYYGKSLEYRTQPYYFPFTEPSFEFALSCPFCDKRGCQVCSQSGWIELLGCGMIHPNVLKAAGIDTEKYSGFAWGCGLDRLVMMKYNIEDVRHTHSANLNFLRQFA